MRLVDKLRKISAPSPNASPALHLQPRASLGSLSLPGEQVEGELGAFWVRRTRLPADHVHGRWTVGQLRETRLDLLADVAREPRLKQSIGLEDAIFFDTETTSLGGGVSTYVFLMGAGYFEGDSFVVEQYFLREVPEERALLHAIRERLQGFGLVVSFHGKGFDAPRISGRLAFHRMGFELTGPHLDLCQVGRSLYRGAFGNCRLQTFERRLVDFHRADDLPGAECPRAFFSHLQGDSSLIPRVFEHNLFDVLTLPAVAASFSKELAAPRHPVVRANLGNLHESAGRDAQARNSYLEALEGLRADRHALLPRALERLALLERRAGRHAESARLLHERIGILPYAFQPLEDLAKYYEHHAHEPERAEAVAVDARSRLLTGKISLDSQSRLRCLRSLDHRLARLRRRLG